MTIIHQTLKKWVAVDEAGLFHYRRELAGGKIVSGTATSLKEAVKKVGGFKS
jgi:hypothetical protein